jgi:U3 small nucleolar RNA-associated protein 21
MNVFLKLHSDIIPCDQELIEALRDWRNEQEREAKKLGELVAYCSSLVGFLRNPRT